MEGPAADEKESGLVTALDQLPFMLHVLVMLVIIWTFSSLGMKSVLMLCFCTAYLFQDPVLVLKQRFDRLRTQYLLKWWNLPKTVEGTHKKMSFLINQYILQNERNQVEKRGREKERRKIAFEEWKKTNTRRDLTDGETLRWLNEGIKSMWPVCMQNFASNHFFKPMAPWFLNAFKPWPVKEVTLQSLHLGDTPPVFSRMRALEQPRDGDSVVFEATMEFFSGNDMNAEMVIQTIRSLGGFKSTFYISNLHIQGTVKFSIKFVEGWPVIGRVRFCFAQAPTVNMTARTIYKKGVDVSLIPGLANWVEKTLATALAQTVVEPNLLVVDMEKLVSNMMWPDPRSQLARANGNDFFTVDHVPSVVRVEILEATNLKAVDRNGFSDPFVELTLGQHHAKTKVKYKTLNPKWEKELHLMPIKSWDLLNVLTLRVRDKDRIGRSEELGICIVAMKEYHDGERHEFDQPLKDVPHGHLRFAITVGNCSKGTQPFEETHTSGAGSEPRTQEIHTNGSAGGHITSPGTISIMKRSKSDTNLRTTPPKHKPMIHHRHSSTGDEIKGMTSSKEQILPSHDEAYENIDMPYGPEGTFRIHHPGTEQFPPPVVQRGGSSDSNPKPSSRVEKTTDVSTRDGEVKKSMSKIFNLGKSRRSKKSSTVGESFLGVEREMNMSEQSGYTSSLDRSTELKVFNTEPYNGNVKMTLDLDHVVDPDENFSGEPPELYIHPTNLEPIPSAKGSENLQSTTSSISIANMENPVVEGFVGSTVLLRGQDQQVAASSLVPSTYGGHEVTNILQVDPQKVSKQGSTHKEQSEKQNSKTMADWWKKVKSLARRSKRKKRQNNVGIESSNIPEEVFAGLDHEYPRDNYYESDQSATQSFRKEMVDIHAITNNNNNNRYGESPEGRKLVTQSARHEPVHVKRIISSVAPVSQSFRLAENFEIRTIPERGGYRHPGT